MRTIDGGATVGNCATGSCLIATPPNTRMKSAITHAKMGRSMKNCAMARGSAGGGSGARRGRRGRPARWPAAGAEPGGCHGTGFTGALPRSFWKPSTMTSSPGFRPSRITQWPPSAAEPTFTGRGATLPSAPTTMTLSPPVPRVTACCGTTMPVGVSACSSRTRTYMPGSSRPVGFGTSARSVIWPEVGSTERSVKSSRPACG